MKAATLRFLRAKAEKRISIHAAREGGDEEAKAAVLEVAISIHAAREGGDRCDRLREADSRYFNPRRP